MANCTLKKRLETWYILLKLLGTPHFRGWQFRMRHIVHQPRSAFCESGCLGMQPKMGGKLLLKLNIGTRPITNKNHEGKMKSTLKRKLIVREPVEREAHGISNALLKFRKFCSVTWIVQIQMDHLSLSSNRRTVAFLSSVRQQLLELS